MKFSPKFSKIPLAHVLLLHYCHKPLKPMKIYWTFLGDLVTIPITWLVEAKIAPLALK
jgi:hypothetical protein